MSKKLSKCSTPTLEEVRDLFQQWRSKRKSKRTRIPTELWQAVESLAGQYTANRISRTLRLNHTEVKNRIEEIPDKPTSQAAFIEVPMPKMVDCAVEMEDAGGRKLKIAIRGNESGLDLMSLARDFWEMER